MKMVKDLLGLFFIFGVYSASVTPLPETEKELEVFGRRSLNRPPVYNFLLDKNATLDDNNSTHSSNNSSSDKEMTDNPPVTSQNSSTINNIEPLEQTSSVAPSGLEKSMGNVTNYRDKSKVIGDKQIHLNVSEHITDLSYKLLENTTSSDKSIGTTWKTRLVDPSVPGAQGRSRDEKINIKSDTEPSDIAIEMMNYDVLGPEDLVCRRLKGLSETMRWSLTRKIYRLMDKVLSKDEVSSEFIVGDDNNDDEESDEDCNEDDNGCGCGCGCERRRDCGCCKKYKAKKRQYPRISGRRSSATMPLFRLNFKEIPDEITTVISTSTESTITTEQTTMELATAESTTEKEFSTMTVPITTEILTITESVTLAEPIPTPELTTPMELITTTMEATTTPSTTIKSTTESTTRLTTKKKKSKRKKCTKKRRKHKKKSNSNSSQPFITQGQ